MKSQTKGWATGVDLLVMVAKHSPQVAYTGLQKSLQQEWWFLQWVVPGHGDLFAPVEQAIHDKFLPTLFSDPSIDNNQWNLVQLPVRNARLALPNPTTTTDSNWAAL